MLKIALVANKHDYNIRVRVISKFAQPFLYILISIYATAILKEKLKRSSKVYPLL